MENLDIGLGTVDPRSGQPVTGPLAIAPMLDSPITCLPETRQLSISQSSEDDLTQVQEFVQKHKLESGQSLTVKGNLRQNLGFWRSIGAPNFILTTIEKGHKLPFASLPLAVRLKNNNSAPIYPDFVDQAVLELVNSGRVCRGFKQPFIVNPLSVSIQPSGKKRSIVDLRHVNGPLIKQRVKYEDWKIAMAYIAKDSYMFSFDLKSGYHHDVEISQDHQTFLRFCWRSPDSNNEVFYVFTVLLFGLSLAPYIFTRLLKPLEKHCRIQGTCIAVF